MKIGKSMFLFFLLSTVILSGCATTNAIKNIGKDYRLDSSKKTGVAVASLSFSGLRRPHPLASFDFYVHCRGIGNDFKKEISICDSADWKPPGRFLFVGRYKPLGRLAVIELLEGDYEFFSWHGGCGGFVTQEMRVKATKEFSRKFKVVSGKAVYLGNIHIHIHKVVPGRIEYRGTKPVTSIQYASGMYNVQEKDLRDRDLSLLYQKYPLIKPDQVIIDIK